MHGLTLTTDEIVALHGLQRGVDERWIGWAVDMLAEGRDTPALRRLAGASAPFHPLEMRSLVDAVLDELDIPRHPSRESAALGLAAVRVCQLLGGKVPTGAMLAELHQLCIELDMFDGLFDFYLLHYAREDLEIHGVQHYVAGATRENIEQLTLDTCRAWLKEHDRRRTDASG